MTNEANQTAEESQSIEKTATEHAGTTEATTETATSGEDTVQAQADGSGDAAPPALEVDEAAEAATEAPAEETASPVAGEPATESEPTAEVATEPAPEATPAPQSTTTYRTITVPKNTIKVEPAPVSTIPAPTPAKTASASPAAKAAKTPPAEADDQGGDIDFGAILEQFEQEQIVFHAGELVEGKIVGITDRGVLVDFGYKSEGFVPPEEFTGPGGEMLAVVGETVEVIIRHISGDGAPQLSRIDALGRKVWDEIEAAFNSETPVSGRVVDKTKGGLRLDINGVEAFLPGSQIDSRPIRGLDTYIGTDIEALVIKFSRRRNNIVLSRKVITDKIYGVQKAETLGKIEVGYIVDGTVKNLTEYGAFVDIGGLDGLLHVTDMSWGRINHPGDLLQPGDHVQVKILKLDREKEKISLGYKQLLPDPWSTVVEVYPVNTKMTGTVSSVTDYGVFVELEAGVEGLVHVSEISWARRAQSPKRLFNKGQQVEVQVLGVDTVEKRISLGMKQFQENPWDMVDIRYPVGSKVRGRVRNLTDFGAFVELEEGIDGLVHVSDITWAKKIKHPKDVLKKDQEVEAIVTSIDKRGQRLSLSMKDLTPSAWEGFVATHRPGDVVRGKVSRFTNFGVFVELGEGLEGLCHISELSDERVDRPESVAELGQEMDFKILRIEASEQKIGLSHRAVASGETAGTTSSAGSSGGGGGGGGGDKMYSAEAKGGMASLGELANLRFGGGADETPAVEEDPEEKKRAKQAAKKAKADEFAAREAGAAAEADKQSESAEEETAVVEAVTEDMTEEADSSDSGTPSAEASPETAEPASDESSTDQDSATEADAEKGGNAATADETSSTEASEPAGDAEQVSGESATSDESAAEQPTPAAEDASASEESGPNTSEESPSGAEVAADETPAEEPTAEATDGGNEASKAADAAADRSTETETSEDPDTKSA